MTIHTLLVLSAVLLMWMVAWKLRALKARQALLLLASYWFYSSWGLGFLAVLIASSILNFGMGSLLRRHLTSGYLWLGVTLNVLLLGFFKYLTPLLPASSTWMSGLADHIIMPVGMSFWTFQALSFLFDIYREEEVDPSLLEFCLYMAFWPTVLSGPVCRLPEMLPQFRKEPVFSWDDVSSGALRLVQGLFMKMYLAQLLAFGFIQGQGVAAGFDQVKSGWGGIDVWLLGVGFGFLLFFDFAGYSNMVIGTARLFGIEVAENFDRPFLSTTPAKFWTRWHMSLSFWIRDYVFVPLATARREHWWPYAAFVGSMTLFGLWHAAKWTFVLWGFYHGVVLVLHRLCQQVKRKFSLTVPRHVGAFFAWASTFSLVSLGWIAFRANDLDQVLQMLRSVFSPSAYRHAAMPGGFYVLMAAVVFGYFAYEGASALLSSWGDRYEARMRTLPQDRRWRASDFTNPRLAGGALVNFFTERLWWWLGPALFVLSVFILMASYERRVVPSVTPFLYTLF